MPGRISDEPSNFLVKKKIAKKIGVSTYLFDKYYNSNFIMIGHTKYYYLPAAKEFFSSLIIVRERAGVKKKKRRMKGDL